MTAREAGVQGRDRRLSRATAGLGLLAVAVFGTVAALPRTPGIASAALGAVALLLAAVSVWGLRPAGQ